MATPDICPQCGAEVPEGAKACPECGSCAETGWSAKASGQSLGLPDDEFDYDRFVKEEFGLGAPPRRRQEWLWGATVVVVILLLVLLLSR